MVPTSWNILSVLEEIGNFYEKFSGDIGSIFIPTAALVFAALAYFSSRSNAKAARAAQLTNLRMSVQASFQEAQRSFSNLQILCRQSESVIKSEWSTRAPKLARPASLFGTDNPEVKKVREIERDGAILLRKADEKLVGLENLNPKQLEARYAEIKTITAQVDVLPMRLASLTV